MKKIQVIITSLFFVVSINVSVHARSTRLIQKYYESLIFSRAKIVDKSLILSHIGLLSGSSMYLFTNPPCQTSMLFLSVFGIGAINVIPFLVAEKYEDDATIRLLKISNEQVNRFKQLENPDISEDEKVLINKEYLAQFNSTMEKSLRLFSTDSINNYKKLTNKLQ